MFTERYLQQRQSILNQQQRPKLDIALTPIDENSPYNFSLIKESNETEPIEPPTYMPQVIVYYIWDPASNLMHVTVQNQYGNENKINHKLYALSPKSEKDST